MFHLIIMTVCVLSVVAAQYYTVDDTSLKIINRRAEYKIQEEMNKVLEVYVGLYQQANNECALKINATADRCKDCYGNIGFWDAVVLGTMMVTNADVQATNQYVLQPAVGGVVDASNTVNNEVFQPIGDWSSGAVNTVGNFFGDGWKWTVGAANSIGGIFSGRKKRQTLTCSECRELSFADNATIIRMVCGDEYIANIENYLAVGHQAWEVYYEAFNVDVVTKVEYANYDPTINGFNKTIVTYEMFEVKSLQDPAPLYMGQYEHFGNETALKILETLNITLIETS